MVASFESQDDVDVVGLSKVTHLPSNVFGSFTFSLL